MAQKFDTTQIDNERRALLVLTEELQKTEDRDTRDLLTGEIQRIAENLERMCLELQAQADALQDGAEEDPRAGAVVEVILTKEQFRRVLEKTGIEVPSVKIPDPTGELTKNMAVISPDFVEQRAIDQAGRFKEMLADFEAQSEIPEPYESQGEAEDVEDAAE